MTTLYPNPASSSKPRSELRPNSVIFAKRCVNGLGEARELVDRLEGGENHVDAPAARYFP